MRILYNFKKLIENNKLSSLGESNQIEPKIINELPIQSHNNNLIIDWVYILFATH